MEIKVVRQVNDKLIISAMMDGHEVRKIIPASAKLTEAEFDAGVPYGLPLEEIISLPVLENFQTQVIDALHRADVWTLEDLYSKGRAIVAVMQSVYGLELATLIRKAEAYEASKPVPKSKSKKKESIQ